MPTLKQVFEGAIGLGRSSHEPSMVKNKEDPLSLSLKDLVSSPDPDNEKEEK
jgi:hypothetical protein